MTRFGTEEPIKHEYEVTSTRIMANLSELDGRLCSHLVGISRGSSVLCFVSSQQTYDCYMPRVRGPLMMSNYQILIGGAYHETKYALWWSASRVSTLMNL